MYSFLNGIIYRCTGLVGDKIHALCTCPQKQSCHIVKIPIQQQLNLYNKTWVKHQNNSTPPEPLTRTHPPPWTQCQQYLSCQSKDFDKGNFPGSSLTLDNCQRDICPGNICHTSLNTGITDMIWIKIHSQVSRTIFDRLQLSWSHLSQQLIL